MRDFQEWISLNSLLLLLVNIVRSQGWNSCMFISHRKYQVKAAACPIFTLFVCTNTINFLNLSSDRLVMMQKFSEAAKNLYAKKTKESITPQKPASQYFWWIAKSYLNKSKFAAPPLFNSSVVLPFESDKAKLFAKNSSKNSHLDVSCISLPVFTSRTNPKLHDISVTLKLVKKIITLIHHMSF